MRDRDLPYVFTCDLGNPLPKGKAVHFRFEFATKNVDTNLGVIKLRMEVNSTNDEPEITRSDNTKEILVPMQVRDWLVSRYRYIAKCSRAAQQCSGCSGITANPSIGKKQRRRISRFSNPATAWK